MDIGKYRDGRALSYDEARKAFAIGGTPVSAEQVREYDRFGQIEWVSDEWRTWARSLTPVAASPNAPAIGEHMRSLQWWHVLLGLVFLPFTIVFLIYLMWKQQLFEKKARVALSVVGVIVALGILGSAIPDAATAPVEGPRVAGQQEAQPATEAPAVEPTVTEEPAPEPAYSEVTVSRVIDGDTAEVTYSDGRIEKVRFIGVDCPESTNQVEPYGKEASAYTKRELEGKTVYLETDAELRDKYGRLLAYVWLAAPSAQPSENDVRANLFNAHLLIDGFAQLLTIPPNTKYVDAYTALQTEARNGQAGLWAPTPEPKPAPAPEPEPEPKAEPKPTPTPAADYIANSNTGKFHEAGCYSVDQMNPNNKVPYGSRQAAIDDGYVPCKNCNP